MTPACYEVSLRCVEHFLCPCKVFLSHMGKSSGEEGGGFPPVFDIEAAAAAAFRRLINYCLQRRPAVGWCLSDLSAGTAGGKCLFPAVIDGGKNLIES